MEPIQLGELIAMEDEKEYIAFADLEEAGQRYLFLIGNFEPIEVKIVRERIDGERLMLDLVEDLETKARLLPQFQAQIAAAMEETEPKKC